MVLILLATLLILAIAYFQIIQGVFSALIMTILTVLCAAMAFTFYEPLAGLLYTRQPAYADAIALIAIFVLPLLGLRIAFDRFMGHNVVLGVWADRIGGGILGLITGMIMVGTLTVAIQMLPFGASVLTYKPFDDSLQRNQQLAPFYSDQFTIGMMEVLSAGSLRGGELLSKSHDDLLLEAFCARNTAGKNGRVDAKPDSLRPIKVYQAPERRLASWRDSVPNNPLMDEADLDKIVIVRCEIDQSARDEGDEKNPTQRWRLPATHFRLVTLDGRSHYPVGYLTYEDGVWEAHGAPVEDGKAQIAKLIVVRPVGESPGVLSVDWIYRIPKQADAKYMVFRRVAWQDVGKIDKGRMPPWQQALKRKSKLRGRRRRRGR